MPTSIALIAHDHKKNDLVALAKKYANTLARYHLIATGTTGQLVQESTNLAVERMQSGPMGGDTQIAARVVTGDVAGVIFLIDPLYAQPHEPDIQALLRVCEVHNVPLATNLATAEMVIRGLSRSRVAHLIFNPISGQGNPDQELSQIRQFLEPQIRLHTLFTTPYVDAAEHAKRAIAHIQASRDQNPNCEDLIIASGGDGTISAVASAVIGTQIPLGVIPRGTANAFAVALGIPSQLRDACETIISGHTRVVDAATCNGIPMVLLAGIGFEAELVDRTDREMKNRLGVLAYLFSGVQQLAEQQPFQATLEIDGTISTVETAAITVANAAPPTSVLAQGFGAVVVDDGLMEVTISTSKTRLQSVNALVSLFASAIVKAPTNREDILCLKTSRLKVSAEPEQKIVIDGEVVGTTPVEFECIPQGLTVLVPLSHPG